MQDNNEYSKGNGLKPDRPTNKVHDRDENHIDVQKKPLHNQIFNKQTKRIAMLWLGWFCITISPIIGAIPGPGFIIIFPIGLALVIKNSRWAKGLYIRFKRKFPEYGRWTDWALRRKGQKEMPPIPSFKEQVKRLLDR